MTTETYILPAYWASALINDDYSGLDIQDEVGLRAWVKRIKPGHRVECVECSDEPYFAHRNDATTLGGDVLEFYFTIS